MLAVVFYHIPWVFACSRSHSKLNLPSFYFDHKWAILIKTDETLKPYDS